jgi:hypothetical protein
VDLGRLGFIISLALLAAPLAAESQTARKADRIGVRDVVPATTATALGLSSPQSLPLRADRVIA